VAFFVFGEKVFIWVFVYSRNKYLVCNACDFSQNIFFLSDYQKHYKIFNQQNPNKVIPFPPNLNKQKKSLQW
jgi:hypothetical protein